ECYSGKEFTEYFRRVDVAWQVGACPIRTVGPGNSILTVGKDDGKLYIEDVYTGQLLQLEDQNVATQQISRSDLPDIECKKYFKLPTYIGTYYIDFIDTPNIMNSL